MSLQFRRAAFSDLPAIVSLLETCELPTDGIGELVRERPQHVIVAELNGGIVGSAALDVRGTSALLRSVAVARDLATLGVGTRLVTETMTLARIERLATVFLLTTTADKWFPRFGFVVAERSAVPDVMLTHVEFTSACPASAVLMSCALSAAPTIREST